MRALQGDLTWKNSTSAKRENQASHSCEGQPQGSN
ncbi:hypothetical protein YPC_1321 [Yersinia pestis biovar Medievalis str. Harbin 35]|nr:hypothetical protein YPC_1321 [Yersinia pestis biovar Medievalis str. Harbin 35]EEO77781.1 hypothetical protein YP516_1468 [Yersinia pestis Nepal516]EEO79691.1 hypothetical protein YPF_3680 [Yersinia pestis biovar Orientalis str. India 195]EEO85063.1 hypothetical protein YPH_0901 [Yersinia pestis biovar Orientalis str. PEXU2]